MPAQSILGQDEHGKTGIHMQNIDTAACHDNDRPSLFLENGIYYSFFKHIR